jgi:microsomal dipeptidase-like Zn-dependent dipeptidase
MGSGESRDADTPIADLHCHYPMHLLARDPKVRAQLPKRRGRDTPQNLTLEYVIRVRRHPGFVAKLRALLVLIAARLRNFRSYEDTWRVDLEKLRGGGVRVVCSVLYLPFAEIGAEYDGDFDELLERVGQVEDELAREPLDSRPVAVRTEDDLDRALAERRIAILHSVEGGFHLGRNKALIDERVAALARLGVAYITLAHLIYRGVATNAPALPMFSDREYEAIFCQPEGGALSPLGELIVRAMYENRILVDLSHMREDAIVETLELLRRLDREHGAEARAYPALATHAGHRFGEQSYMLDAETIRAIAAREGVIGLIMAQHQLNDGLGVDDPDDPARTVPTICSHIDAIREITGSNDFVGIGSDLDGFIKPTMAGIDDADDLAKLRDPLAEAYPDDVEAILSGNAVRALRRAYRGRPAGGSR